MKCSLMFLARIGMVCFAALGCATASVAQNRVTILTDAFGKDAALSPDWGYSALIEFEGKRILFDTGDDAALFQKNTARMHVDLTHLDYVVISHAHGDHTAGLRYVLSLNPKVPLFVPDDPFFTGTEVPKPFLTTDAVPELPAAMRYFGGGSPEHVKAWRSWDDTQMTVVQGATSVSPHVRLVALTSEKAGFKGLHEISMVLDTPKGPVIVAGCSHPGIEAIVTAAMIGEPAEPVYMIFGGLHLVQDTREQITATLSVLEDRFHVQRMAVGHCTGELAFQMIQQRWGKNDVYAGLGETIAF